MKRLIRFIIKEERRRDALLFVGLDLRWYQSLKLILAIILHLILFGKARKDE